MNLQAARDSLQVAPRRRPARRRLLAPLLLLLPLLLVPEPTWAQG